MGLVKGFFNFFASKNGLFNLLKADVKLDYRYPPQPIIDYPRLNQQGEAENGDGTNWWVCVFNTKAQFPKVTYNVEVEWKIKFLGADTDNGWWEAAFAYASALNPTLAFHLIQNSCGKRFMVRGRIMT